jgi:golgin subfamily B member 1
MELTQRIKQRLREVDDWNSVIDELEADAAAAGDESAQSAAFFDLARACEDVFLDKQRAMQCYQKAFKLDQKNLAALRRARLIYHESGQLEMVTRLMGLELKANRDPDLAGELNYAYGTAQLNLGQIDTARGFLEAATSADPNNETYQERFQETLYDRNNWQLGLDTIYDQLQAMTGESDPLAAKVENKGPHLSAVYMKAVRILQQEAPEDERLMPLIFKALDAHPLNEEAGFLAETLLSAGGHLQHIQKLQDRRLSLVQDDQERLALLRRFALVWQTRLGSPEMATYFHHQALDLAYESGSFGGSDGSTEWHMAAYRQLVQQADASGQADSLIPLAERALGAVTDPVEKAILALQAGELAWRKFNDQEIAGKFLREAVSAAPDHPLIAEFQSTVGPLEPAGDQAPAAPEPEP